MKIKITLGHIARSTDALIQARTGRFDLINADRRLLRSRSCPLAIALLDATGLQFDVGQTIFKLVAELELLAQPLPPEAQAFVLAADRDGCANLVNPCELDLPIEELVEQARKVQQP